MRILFAIAAVGCVCIPAPAAAMTPLQRETALWNASKQGQIDLFAASISPGFVGVYATGTHNRAQEIRGVRSQSLHSFALGNFRTTTIGPDDMLMTYTADAAGSDHGKSFRPLLGDELVASHARQVADGVPQRGRGEVREGRGTTEAVRRWMSKRRDA